MNRSPHSCGLLLAAVACASAQAGDQRLELPAGWDIHGAVIGPDRVAYRGTQMGGPEGEPIVVRSRIFQVIDDRIVTTDLKGSCRVDGYSPDGKFLLARQLDPAAGRCCNCPSRAVLIDARGAVVTQLAYTHRSMGFSTTGEVFYEGASYGSLGDRNGNRIDVYDLEGSLVRTIEPGPFVDAVVLGDGSDVVLRDEYGLRRLHVGERPHTSWTLSLPPPEYPGERLIPIAPDKILVRGNARLAVIDFDGVVLFQHDPERSPAADPGREFGLSGYFDVRPCAPDRLWLKRADGDRLLDLERKLLSSIRVDRTPPVDFEVRDLSPEPDEHRGYLVFIGEREMLIRSVGREDADPAVD